MRKYTIEIEEHERDLTSSAGEKTTELGMTLQIYQDLKDLGSKAQEDELISNILKQILLEHFEKEEDIPVPAEYRVGRDVAESEYYEKN